MGLSVLHEEGLRLVTVLQWHRFFPTRFHPAGAQGLQRAGWVKGGTRSQEDLSLLPAPQSQEPPPALDFPKTKLYSEA